MSEEWLSRTELLLGPRRLEKLRKAHVLIVGLGGVGAPLAEHLCRAGIGKLSLVDGDRVHTTNRNRQLLALSSTEGELKTEVLARRFRQINPDVELELVPSFLRDQHMIDVLAQHPYDYVADAIDTLSPKIFLIVHSLHKNLPLVSSMGSGGKLNPAKVMIGDIADTIGCPMARALRKKLHRHGIRQGFKAVYSPEEVPPEAIVPVYGEQNKKSNVGTISYMPPIFGAFMASVIVRDIISS